MRCLAGALAVAAAGAAEAQDSGVRIIAPEIVAPPLIAPQALERTEPREPLNPLADGSDRLGENPDRLFHPVVLAAGHVSANGRDIVLDSIKVVDADQVCDARHGGTWPCGRHARTAFRLWLRGRALACDPADENAGDGKAEKHVAHCVVGQEDPAAWLVTQGWALASPGGPYEKLEEEAREARRGIFGGRP
ncbi:thermonuclease family protein [Nitratireductor luteus]|uniref:thermonuclease family protein n=1 Tax=Nitratireductor luteus TaxID=2976980 RepID=UPI00223F861F|nr:thermonuclease family protein [Nitratireductor luteus]